jgi:adenylate kinase family enzyme
MKKVIVVGSSGAGKTYFSRRLSTALGIELIHIDTEYWGPGWTEPSKVEWKDKLSHLLARESWIIDGNYTNTLDMRLAACDTVIFLDIRRTLCIWRVIRRTLKFYRRKRPDMADGCYERLDLPFLAFVWNYPERTKPKVMTLIEKHRSAANVVHLTSPRAVKQFLSELENGSMDRQVLALS